jgi:tyrosinase
MRGLTPIVTNQLDYNPRCLRRDLTTAASATFTMENLLNITIGAASHTVEHFQEELQGPLGTLRMHGAGHYSMGGDGSDGRLVLISPNIYLQL